MNKIYKLLKVIICSILLLSSFSYSQELTKEKKIFQISGSVDTYMRYNFAENQNQAPGTFFANGAGFSLGMFNIITSYNGEKSGFVSDLVFGPRGIESVFNSRGSSSIVNQLYIYYNLTDKVKITMGNFNSFLGYEKISPILNFNYSTSYMFTFGPLSHTGLKADLSLSEDISLLVSLLNPSDVTDSNPNDTYMFGSQFGIKDHFFNYLTGQGYNQIEYIGGIDISDSFFLGINATSASLSNDRGGFSGIALYPQIKLLDSFELGSRLELFSDKKDFTGVFGANEADNISITITGNFTSDNMIVKSEIRVDNASEEIFGKIRQEQVKE